MPRNSSFCWAPLAIPSTSFSSPTSSLHSTIAYLLYGSARKVKTANGTVLESKSMGTDWEKWNSLESFWKVVFNFHCSFFFLKKRIVRLRNASRTETREGLRGWICPNIRGTTSTNCRCPWRAPNSRSYMQSNPCAAVTQLECCISCCRTGQKLRLVPLTAVGCGIWGDVVWYFMTKWKLWIVIWQANLTTRPLSGSECWSKLLKKELRYWLKKGRSACCWITN